MPCLKWIAQIGKNSLIIMGLHSEIRVLCYIGMKIIGIPFKEYGAIPVFVITIAVCMPMAFFANKYLPFFMGVCTSKNIKRA